MRGGDEAARWATLVSGRDGDAGERVSGLSGWLAGAVRAGFWAGGSGTAGWAGSGWTRDGLAREERKREWAAWAEVVGRTGFWILWVWV